MRLPLGARFAAGSKEIYKKIFYKNEMPENIVQKYEEKRVSEITLRRSNFRVGWLQIAIIVLTIVTALIHLYKGVGMMNPPAGMHPGGPGGPAGGGQFTGQPGGSGHPGGAPRAFGPSILSFIPIPLSALFILNGVAYLVLLLALYLPALKAYQRIVRWLLIVLAVLTIVAYFLIAGVRFNLLGYIDKPIELILIVLLVIEDRQSQSPKIKLS